LLQAVRVPALGPGLAPTYRSILPDRINEKPAAICIGRVRVPASCRIGLCLR
jgi:hypothetical protein